MSTAPNGEPQISARPFRVLVALLILAGAVIHLPAYRAPLVLDDYAQRALYEGWLPGQHGPLDLYDLVAPSTREPLLADGALPWWTDPTLSIRFLRPLSSAFRWLDFRVFGTSPLGPHLISLGWWVAAVIAVASLLRRYLGPVAALAGTAVFALSPCHSAPLGWLAARGILPATCFGALGLLAYLRWRDEARVARGLLALGLLLGASLCGEYALSFVGYIVGIEVFHSKGQRRERLLRLALASGALAVVPVCAVVLGHRPTASGYYVDPIQQPGLFVRGVPERLTALLGSMVLGFDDGWLLRSAHPTLWIAGAAVSVALVILWFLRPAPKRDGQPHQHAKAMTFGALGALLPVLATPPQWRLLGPAMLGVAAVVGASSQGLGPHLARGQRPAPRTPGFRPRPMPALAALVALTFVFAVQAPLDAHRADVKATDAELIAENRLDAIPRIASGTIETTLVLRAISPPSVYFTPYHWKPRSRWLVAGQTGERIVAVRSGPRTVEIYPERGPIAPCGPSDLVNVRGTDRGSIWRNANASVRVLDIDENHCATRIELTLDRDADDPSVRWLVETHTGFEDIAAPAVGIGVRLEP